MENLIHVLQNNTHATALWGIMSFHNMVEHLSLFYQLASNKQKTDFVGDEQKIAVLKRITLQNDAPLRPGIKSPLLPQNETVPYLTNSIDHAIEMLIQSIKEYTRFWNNNPAATVMHPTLGPLTFAEWEIMQAKHVNHHLAQFGITM